MVRKLESRRAAAGVRRESHSHRGRRTPGTPISKGGHGPPQRPKLRHCSARSASTLLTKSGQERLPPLDMTVEVLTRGAVRQGRMVDVAELVEGVGVALGDDERACSGVPERGG